MDRDTLEINFFHGDTTFFIPLVTLIKQKQTTVVDKAKNNIPRKVCYRKVNGPGAMCRRSLLIRYSSQNVRPERAPRYRTSRGKTEMETERVKA